MVAATTAAATESSGRRALVLFRVYHWYSGLFLVWWHYGPQFQRMLTTCPGELTALNCSRHSPTGTLGVTIWCAFPGTDQRWMRFIQSRCNCRTRLKAAGGTCWGGVGLHAAHPSFGLPLPLPYSMQNLMVL